MVFVINMILEFVQERSLDMLPKVPYILATMWPIFFKTQHHNFYSSNAACKNCKWHLNDWMSKIFSLHCCLCWWDLSSSLFPLSTWVMAYQKCISIMFKMGEIHQESNQIVKKWLLCDVPNINGDIYPVTHQVWRISLDTNHYDFAQEKLTPSKMKPVFAKLNDKILSCDDQKIGIWCTYIKT